MSHGPLAVYDQCDGNIPQSSSRSSYRAGKGRVRRSGCSTRNVMIKIIVITLMIIIIIMIIIKRHCFIYTSVQSFLFLFCTAASADLLARLALVSHTCIFTGYSRFRRHFPAVARRSSLVTRRSSLAVCDSLLVARRS